MRNRHVFVCRVRTMNGVVRRQDVESHIECLLSFSGYAVYMEFMIHL